MSRPLLGALALARGLLDAPRLERALLEQRRAQGRGDYRRLGAYLCEQGLRADQVRALLSAQGIELLECPLCGRHFNGWQLQAAAPCPRCGDPLAPAPPGTALDVEDTICPPGPGGDAFRQAVYAASPKVGRYVIVGEVGRGAMGVVYKAFDTQLRCFLALKFLQTDDYEEEERFRREAQALRRLSHPGIVRGQEVEEVPGLVYLAMELAPGVPLGLLLAQQALAPREVVGICAQVAAALAHAHAAGLIHRDVKPGNVVVDREGRARLVDFGIAKARDESMSLTEDGQVLGSLTTMAPEYLAGGVESLDARADLYAVGVILYMALSGGAHPLGTPGDPAFPQQVATAALRPLRKADPRVTPALAAIVDRAVAPDPARRTPSARELAEELEVFLASEAECHSEPPAGVLGKLRRFLGR